MSSPNRFAHGQRKCPQGQKLQRDLSDPLRCASAYARRRQCLCCKCQVKTMILPASLLARFGWVTSGTARLILIFASFFISLSTPVGGVLAALRGVTQDHYKSDFQTADATIGIGRVVSTTEERVRFWD